MTARVRSIFANGVSMLECSRCGRRWLAKETARAEAHTKTCGAAR